MSVLMVRGGIPRVRRLQVATGGQEVNLPFYTNYLIARNKDTTAANIVRLYFTKADFIADANYVQVPIAAAATPQGEWQGPVETDPGENGNIWVKSEAGTPVLELVVFQRRG
jgi:hypothetical protein